MEEVALLEEVEDQFIMLYYLNLQVQLTEALVLLNKEK